MGNTFANLEKWDGSRSYYDVRDELKRHIYDRSLRAFAAGDAARDALKTKEDIRRQQASIRGFLVRCIGGLPPSESPLNPRVVGIVERYEFRIEKIIFESRPGHFVTTNLYLPRGLQGRRGAVLFVCGHHREAKHVAEYQRICQALVRAGLIVFAQDPPGQGERFGYWEPSLGAPTIECNPIEHDYVGTQCMPLGDGLARYFVHDSMRAIDYLLTRPEVDGGKIGVCGNSGGGTQSSLMMMADPRLAAAAPATFIMNRETYLWTGQAQDAEQVWPGFSAAGFDHEDILLAMAPKPVRVLAVRSDFFPIEGTRRTVARCKRLWKILDREAEVDLVEDDGTHKFTDNLAVAAAEFFSRHLVGKAVRPDMSEVQALEPTAQLWCTRSGQVRGEIAGAKFVYDANQERLTQVRPTRAAEADSLKWLRERVTSNRKPVDLNPRFYHTDRIDDLALEGAFWWSQESLHNHAYLFVDAVRSDAAAAVPVTIAVWDGGTTALAAHGDWIRAKCKSGEAVMVLDVCGVGSLLPNPLETRGMIVAFGTMHKLADDLTWLDDDLAAMRTFDVLRALEMASAWPGIDASKISLYAHGRFGLYAQLAAAIDGRVKELEVVGGLGSFADFVRARHYDNTAIRSLIIRGILQHCDLPDLMTWTAARGTRVVTRPELE